MVYYLRIDDGAILLGKGAGFVLCPVASVPLCIPAILSATDAREMEGLCLDVIADVIAE